MSLTKTTYSMISGAPANVLDFGAVGDGVTDCTIAIQNAIDSVAVTGGTVFFPSGEYLISSSLVVSTYGVSLIGVAGAALWNGVSTINDGGAILVKSSTMNVEGIIVSGGKCTLQDISLIGKNGNINDGIYLKDAQSCMLLNVCVAKMGGCGIRIGTKSGSNGNVNGWQLANVTSQSNASHGLLIQDESASSGITGPNANAGTATGLQLSDNAGEGLRIINGQFNTFVGLLSQQNKGYGVALEGTAALSLYTTFIGGDVEGNILGNWYVSSVAKHLVFCGAFSTVPTFDPDTNFATLIYGGSTSVRSLRIGNSVNTINTYANGTFTPYLSGSTAPGFNTYTNEYGYYTQIGRIIICEGVLTLTAKGTGGNVMVGNLQLWLGNFMPLGLNQLQARSVFTLTPDGGLNLGGGYSVNIVGILNENTRYLNLYKVSTSDGSLVALTPSDITNSFSVRFSGSYLATN